jgi:uncharacterized caspase-like protein
MKWFVTAVALVALCWTCVASAQDQQPLRGVALVIGESKYVRLPKLANPSRDARAIDDMLAELGFEVERLIDGRGSQISQRLDEFAASAQSADVAIVYYAGHGVEIGGKNYIMGIDADISSNSKAQKSLIPVDELIDRLATVAPITIVLLDACRTSPVDEGKELKLEGMDQPAVVGAAGLAVIVRGPSPVADPASAETVGTVVGFSASPGQPAFDGDGDNSPYAAALLKHLVASGYSFGDVMTMVTSEVYVTTHARQLPWTNSSLNRVLYFGGEVEAEAGEMGEIINGRRQLLLRIASAPDESRGAVENVARDTELDLAQLYSMLDVINGGTGDLSQANEGDLRDIAGRLRSVLEDPLLPEMPTDPELARLDELAREAIAQGDVKRAYQYRQQQADRAGEIEKSLDSQQAALDAQRKELAGVYARVAETAIMNRDTENEARLYRAAAEQVDTFDKDLSFKLRLRSANAFARLAIRQGDIAAADTAIELYLDLLEEVNPEKQAETKATMEIQIARVGQQIMWQKHDDGRAALVRDNAALATAYFSPDHDRRAWLDGLSLQAQAAMYFQQPDSVQAGFLEAGIAGMTLDSDPDYWADFNRDLAQIEERRGDEASLESAKIHFQNSVDGYRRNDWLGGVFQSQSGHARVSLRLAMQKNVRKAIFEAGKEADRNLEELTRSMAPSRDTSWTFRDAEQVVAEAGMALGDIDMIMRALDSYARTRDLFDPDNMAFDFAYRAKFMADVLRYAGENKSSVELLKQSKADFEAAQNVFKDNGDTWEVDHITGQLAELDRLIAKLGG